MANTPKKKKTDSKKRRAIVLVPGFQKSEQFDARDKLVTSIENYTDGFKINRLSEPASGANPDEVHLSVHPRAGGEAFEISVFESYWGDIAPDWSEESPWRRLARATNLLTYWFFGGIAKMLTNAKAVNRTSLFLLIAGSMLIIWYLTVLAVVAQAVLDDDLNLPKWANEAIGISPTEEAPAQDPLVDATSDEENTLKSWLVWYLSISPLMLVFGSAFLMGKLETFSNIAEFVRLFLRDEPLQDDLVGIRTKTKQRLITRLDGILERGDGTEFDEVFVVAHSLGGGIAIDALAELETDLSRITLITWGSLLGLSAIQEPIISDEIKKLCNSKTKLSNWIDIVFAYDIYATPAPVMPCGEGKLPQFRTPKTPKGHVFKKAMLHSSYYRNEKAVLPLIQSVEELAVNPET